MKMSDVFVLPLTPRKDANGQVVLSCNTLRRDLAASHAINHFDGLVNAVEVLLLHPELADRQAISELLARAKGES